MSSYWAKRRKVNKLVRETEQDILIEYNLIAAANASTNLHCLESTTPVTTSSECLLDALPTTSDLPIHRPLIISDQSENINSKTSKASPDFHFESIYGADKIESENDSDSDEHNEDVLMISLKYWVHLIQSLWLHYPL